MDPHIPHLYSSPDGLLIYESKGKAYIHGLLALKLRRTAVVAVSVPAPDIISLHKESKCNPAFVQSSLHAYATQY